MRILLFLLATFTTQLPAQQKRALVPEDLYRMRTAGDVVVSPDGRWVVYVQTAVDSPSNRYVRDLYAARSDGSATRRLTYTPQSNEGSPSFSPDGRYLAFTARREGDERAAEIYILPFTEPGEARRVTQLARGTSRPVWSPDGSRIAFTVNDSTAADTTKQKSDSRTEKLAANARKNDPRVITRLNYVGEQSFNDERWSQIYVVDAHAEGAQARRITSGDFASSSPAWSADGKSLVYSARPAKGNYHADYEQDSDIYIIAVDGNSQPRNLTPGGRSGLTAAVAGRAGVRGGDVVYQETNPRFSPDGKWIAFTRSALGQHQTAVNTQLVVMNADGSTPACVTCGMDRDAGSFAWDQRGDLYFTVPDRGGVHLYRSTQNQRSPTALLTGARGVLSFDVAGGMIAWAEMNPARPSDVYTAPVAAPSRSRRLTMLNDSLLAAMHVQPYEEMWYAAPDGYRVQGWIVRPPQGATRNTRLAIEMHGGPHVMWGPGEPSMWLEYQSLAGAGYTVFFSNPRGSEGYGFEHKKAIHRNWGDLPMGDVLAGADSVIARGWADPQKQYITGGSYAGYLTAWIISRTNRFKAAVAQRGVFDMVSWWGMATTWRLYESEFGSTPWEDPQLAWQHSPITYAANIETPLLLLHGEQDFRVGLGGVQTLFRMLKAQGKEVELVLYPREGHEVTRSGEPHHRVDHMLRIIEWFERH
jgi:dipeptidyl aminopeptidase/acylaminoacyl peptidase